MLEIINKNQAEMAADFTAADSEGRIIHLADYIGKKPVVLVFNRGFF